MSPSVLVVDDDPAFCSLATEILNSLGVEVVGTAGNAAAAISAACALRPDAALVDVGLPDADGVDLAHQLAALPWRPRILLTSSDGEMAAGIEARAAGRRLAFVAKAELPNVPLRKLLTSA
jgi:CheY-like chemotaxis protein